MPDQKLLLINADDYALHPAVNQAIIQAHQEGILTSCSILACGSAFPDAVHRLKKVPSLGVGIHLCLVDQFPVSPPSAIRSVVDSTGRFWPSYSTFAMKYFLKIVRLDEIRRELLAQVEKVADSGLRITHVDGHQHLHILPGVADIVVDICRKFNIRCVRVPGENVAAKEFRISRARSAQRLMLNRVAAKALESFAGHGLKSTGNFFGFSCRGNLTEQVWSKLIPLLPAGSTEVMSHPGVNDTLLRDATGWNYHWSAELSALCSPEIKASLLKQAIRLINYGELV